MSFVHLSLKLYSNVHAGIINFVIVIVSVSKPLEDLNDSSGSLEKICDRFDTPIRGLGNYEDVAKYRCLQNKSQI